jgi:hypothetical protein
MGMMLHSEKMKGCTYLRFHIARVSTSFATNFATQVVLVCGDSLLCLVAARSIVKTIVIRKC